MRKFLKNKNIILIIFGLLIIFSLLFSLKVYGEVRLETDWPVAPGGKELEASSTLVDFIDYAYRWAMLLGGLFAFFALIMGGFQYLTSTGDPNKMRDAKERVIAAILGLVLLLSTYVILNTLNPELLTMRMPTTSVPWGEYGGWEAPDLSRPCEFVKIYDSPKYQGNVIGEFGPGHWALDDCKDVGSEGMWVTGWGESHTEVGSILINGACQLNLYEKPDCTGNFAAIAKSMPSVKWIVVDKVRGVLVTDISPTRPPIVLTLGTTTPFGMSGTSAQATLRGELTDLGKADVCYGFFEYGTNSLFLTGRFPKDYKQDKELYVASEFSTTVPGLAPNSVYYWKAAARNEAGISYGSTASFTTPF